MPSSRQIHGGGVLSPVCRGDIDKGANTIHFDWQLNSQEEKEEKFRS